MLIYSVMIANVSCMHSMGQVLLCPPEIQFHLSHTATLFHRNQHSFIYSTNIVECPLCSKCWCSSHKLSRQGSLPLCLLYPNSNYYYSHLTREELEAWEGCITHSRSLCQQLAYLNPGSLAAESALSITWQHFHSLRAALNRTLSPCHWWVNWGSETVRWCGQAHRNSKKQSWSSVTPMPATVKSFKVTFCLQGSAHYPAFPVVLPVIITMMRYEG